MKMNKRLITILAIIFAVSAVVSLPIFAAFAANVPVRSVNLESDGVSYEAGDSGSWRVDKFRQALRLGARSRPVWLDVWRYD